MSGIGLPDWYNIKKAGAVSALGDLGELAARLGSIVTFDRRGDVVWLDGFECGINKWVATTWGTGASIGLSKDYARNGNWSCKMTAGSDGLRRADIYRKMPRPVMGKLGFEFSFAMDSKLDELRMGFDLYDGSYRHEPYAVYDYGEKKLKIQDGAGDLQDVAAGLDVYESHYPFWTVKLVVDFKNQKYTRLIFQETEYDISSYSYLYNADTGNPYLLPRISVVGIAEANAPVYIDDVIITQNEP